MNDTLSILFVIALVGGLIGVAYYLDNRRKKAGPIGPALPEPGPIGRILLWIARILVGFMVLSIIGAFVLKSFALVVLTGICLLLYIIDGIIYRIIRLTGK